MKEDEMIIFDPLGELLKVVEDINKAEEEGRNDHGLRTQAD